MRKTGRKHDFMVLCITAAVWAWAACPSPVAADDSDGGDGKQAVDLLKNLQSLEAASSDKAEYEAGFTFLQTFAGITGQPELVVGLKALQGVLDFTGALSGSAESATTQALATLALNFKQVDAEVKAQGAQIDALTQTLASKINSDLKFQVNLIHASLQTQLNALQPPGNPGQLGQQVAGPGGTAVPRVSPAVARQVAHDVMAQLDLFVDNQSTLFTGEDIQTVYTNTGQQDNNGQPIRKASLQLASGFKPYPALNVYLFGLQMWISAMEVESGGTDAGHGRILRDQGYNGQASYPKELQKHIAFLRAMDASGKIGANPNGIEPQIAKNVHCSWSADRYPDGAGRCGAVLVCDDHIARRVLTPAVSTSWMQSDRNAFCNASQAPAADLTSMEQALRYQYGVIAMHTMANALQRVADHGTAVQGKAAAPVGNFGTKADAEFFLYAVDGGGAVRNFAGSRNQPFATPIAVGSLGDVKALIPGGGTTFYALTRDGHLNWYQFTGNSGKPFNGPVTVSSSFGSYTSVFGGGDGVIYAIQPDGTLMWFRHAGFANGAAGTFTGPKPVASGFGSYRSVFSAGDGVIYAIGGDGSLQWYRHKDYLTGASAAPSQMPHGNATPGRPVSGIAAPSSLEGPVGVGSGWGGFRQVIPAGNGILLAVQTDGKLAWYRHDDYLTGTSTNPASSNAAVQNARQPVSGGYQAGSESPRPVSTVSGAAQSGTTLESSWGSVGRPASGNVSVPAENVGGKASTPQWGSQPTHVATTGASPSSVSMQAAAAASALHPGTTAKPSGSPVAGTVANANATSSAAAAAMAKLPHWEGPTVVDPQSKWDGYAAIAAVLPVTVQTNAIK